jgi:hypothetical protein
MDPLRPFATLIRSLWTAARSERTPRASHSGAGAAPLSGSQPVAVVPSIAARLAPRLAALKEWNAQRARELFVEHILLAELGGELARDPKFAELVQRVSLHLAEEPAIGARLDELLQAVVASRRST